jgi:hypothetical protein
MPDSLPASLAPRVPRGLPLLGHALAFGRDPDRFIAACGATHGEVFRFRMPGGERTFLLDPFDYPAYFAEKRLRFHESAAEIGGTVFGYDIERASRPDMEELSHMISRDLRGDELQALSERMQVLFVRRLFGDVGARSAERPLLALLTEHFFAAGAEAIFGEGFHSKDLYRQYATVDRYFALAVAGVPAALLPGFSRARAKLAAEALHLRPGHALALDRRRAFYAEHGLPASIAGPFDASILWASQANTVAAAFWTVRYLLGDPRAKAAVLDEVRSLTSPPHDPRNPEPISRDALRRMVLLDSACSEAMRLTSAPMITRRAAASFELPLTRGGSLAVRQGDELMLYPRHTHLDPEIFGDPCAYRFDRFVDERGRPARFEKDGRRVTMPYLPFGGGVSMCPGRFFARNEIKILVATLLTWCETELASVALPALDFSRVGLGVLPPREDVSIRMRPVAR